MKSFIDIDSIELPLKIEFEDSDPIKYKMADLLILDTQYAVSNKLKNILERENLYCLFVLIDSRHEPQAIDIEFMKWLGTNKISFVIVFTKIDKLKSTEVDDNIKVYESRFFSALTYS